MSDTKKPRADSVLKTLPDERQAAIAEHGRTHTLAETVAWLRADGVKTSSAALSGFLSWYALRGQLGRNESTINSILADLKTQNPNLSDVDLQQAGQMFFTALAIEQQDSLAWKRAQDAKAKLGALELSRQRFLVDSDAYFASLLKRAEELLGDSKMTQADRIAEMRKAAFKDVEALQASGKLQIPKA